MRRAMRFSGVFASVAAFGATARSFGVTASVTASRVRSEMIVDTKTAKGSWVSAMRVTDAVFAFAGARTKRSIFRSVPEIVIRGSFQYGKTTTKTGTFAEPR